MAPCWGLVGSEEWRSGSPCHSTLTTSHECHVYVGSSPRLFLVAWLSMWWAPCVPVA